MPTKQNENKNRTIIMYIIYLKKYIRERKSYFFEKKTPRTVKFSQMKFERFSFSSLSQIKSLNHIVIFYL